MKLLLSLVILVVVVGVILGNPKGQRLAKSIWLIMQTSPYSQSGSGQGQIIVIGDSTAYGTGVDTAKESIAGLIGNDFSEYQVRTLAKNGRVISEVVPVLEALELSVPVNLLLLQIGGNDILGNHSSEAIETDTRQMLNEAKKHASKVIFMSSGNVGTASFYVKNGQPNLELERRTLVAREIFQRLSVEAGVTYVDLFIPSAEDPFLKSPEIYFAFDGLHPSPAGYKLWYEKLAPKVREVLISQ